MVFILPVLDFVDYHMAQDGGPGQFPDSMSDNSLNLLACKP